MLAMPCPLHSRLRSLVVSVRSSPYDGQRNRIRQDNHQGFQIQRHIRPQENGERIRKITHIANGPDIQTGHHGHSGEHHDANQRGRQDLANHRHAFTKPVTTERDTKRIRLPSFR